MVWVPLVSSCAVCANRLLALALRMGFWNGIRNVLCVRMVCVETDEGICMHCALTWARARAPMCTRLRQNVNVVPIGRRREFFEFALVGETAEIKVQSVGMDSCIYMDVDATVDYCLLNFFCRSLTAHEHIRNVIALTASRTKRKFRKWWNTCANGNRRPTMLESNDIIIPIVQESVFDYKLFSFTAFDRSNTKRSMSKLRHMELILLNKQQQILRISIVIAGCLQFTWHDFVLVSTMVNIHQLVIV